MILKAVKPCRMNYEFSFWLEKIDKTGFQSLKYVFININHWWFYRAKYGVRLPHTDI